MALAGTRKVKDVDDIKAKPASENISICKEMVAQHQINEPSSLLKKLVNQNDLRNLWETCGPDGSEQVANGLETQLPGGQCPSQECAVGGHLDLPRLVGISLCQGCAARHSDVNVR